MTTQGDRAAIKTLAGAGNYDGLDGLDLGNLPWLKQKERQFNSVNIVEQTFRSCLVLIFSQIFGSKVDCGIEVYPCMVGDEQILAEP